MPEVLGEVLASAAAEELARRPASDRWSVAENLDHLFDIECAIRERCLRVVEEEDAVLELYDPHAERRLVHSGREGRPT